MQVQQRHDADMDKVFAAPLMIRGTMSILSAVRLVHEPIQQENTLKTVN